MFVLCPHCHFLVGIDPRTGAPPANCPKCGDEVVPTLPEAGTAPSTPNATTLEPFAPVALPSVAPVLPEPEPEPEPEPAAGSAPAPAPVPAPVPTPEPEAAVAPESSPRLRWWRPASEPPAAAVPATQVEASLPAVAVDSPPSVATPAAPPRRRRATKPASPPVAPPTAIEPVEVEIDALPPAVQVDDVIQVPVVEAAVAVSNVVPPAAPVETRAMQDGARDGEAGMGASIEPGDSPVPAHPLRRRTDFVTDTAPEASESDRPASHPLRRRTDVVAPSFTRPRAGVSATSRASWRSMAALAGLSLLLVLQLLLAQRDTLAASPRWRPAIAGLCATLRCTLPPWREPTAFTMLSRDVRPHAGMPGTLMINASFRNDARWPQPWPGLLLTLSDLDGRMVGARTFAAREYLGAVPTQSGLAPGQTAAVTLVVVEPAPDIVAFTFDFR